MKSAENSESLLVQRGAAKGIFRPYIRQLDRKVFLDQFITELIHLT